MMEETVYRKDAGQSLLSYTRNISVGDRFRMRYTSTTLEWGWGTKEGDLEGDLEDVQVWLPCWEQGVVMEVPDGFEEVKSAVLKEGDSGGRPKLKVTEAVSVELEIFSGFKLEKYIDLIILGDTVTLLHNNTCPL